MKIDILALIKKVIIIFLFIGVIMIISSPVIGDDFSPNSLWWIEPIAYLGGSIFIIGCIILYLVNYFC